MKKKKPIQKASAENTPEKVNATISSNDDKVLPKVFVNEINDNLPYDPKTCTKKRFEDFIPQTLINLPPNIIAQHSVDFYIENRSSLIMYESFSSSLPSNMKETYSDFSNSVGNLKFKDTIHTNKEAELVVNSYDSASAEKYVIKKCWHYFDADKKNINTILGMESFIKNKFNEYSIMKIVNGSPNSVQPMQFHIVYLPKNKYIVTELLMPFGETPLTEYLHKLTSEEVLDIVKQVANALDYLDSFNIEHNDIKAGNILVDSILGKRIIRVIDLDIGRNISITNKSTQRAGLTGFTSVYCSPEIYQKVKDPTLNSKTFSSRKSQIYSLGVLILFMCRFFPNDMNSNQFDAFKINESKYQQVLTIFSDSTKSIMDPLHLKLMKIAEICLSFNPECRLSAKELKEILQNFESKGIETISNQYSSILDARIKHNNNFKTITIAEHGNILNKIKEEFLYQIQEEQKSINKLIADNFYLTKELKIKNEDMEKLKISEVNMRSLIIKSNQEIERIQKDLTDKSFWFENQIAAQRGELKEKLKLQIAENQESFKKIESLEKENRRLNLKSIESEVVIKEFSDKVEELKKYEKMIKGNISQFEILKKKLEEHKMPDFLQCNSYPELAGKLYETILNLESETNKVQKVKYVEGFQFSENSIYNGPVNEANQPQGPGALLFKDAYIRFIGEFENGKIKNDLGFLVNEGESYWFGKIYNGVCESICFLIPQYPKYLGKEYYFGETKNNKREGKGKEVYSESGYYEGEWKNDNREGKGKDVYPDGAYNEGEWKNNIAEGKGKYFVIKSGQVEEIQECICVKNERQGKFLITDFKHKTSFRNYKDDEMI